MRSLLILGACLLSTAAFADDVGQVTNGALSPPPPPSVPDVTLVVRAQEQAAWGQVSAVMDKCVADAVLRSQAPSCRDLAGFLDAWAAKVKAAKPAQPVQQETGK